MIKLFRNIRQNLLNEGKTMKYFKYAIGEIVLVVIGILITENLAPSLKGGFSRRYNPLSFCALAPFLASDEAFSLRGMHKASEGIQQQNLYNQ